MAIRLGDKASSNGKKPETPIIGTASAGNAQATVSFTAPNFLGKPTGTLYTARAYTNSGTVDAGISGTSSTSPITVTGLTNGTSYTFKVELSNGILTSNQSALSNAVTPVAPPFFPFFPGFVPFFPFFPGFVPFFPYFPPFVPYFPFFPSFGGGCIDQDTKILIVGENDSFEYKMIKDISSGDLIWAANWDTLVNENEEDPLTWTGTELKNIKLEKTNVVSIIPTEKDITLYINNDQEKRFSLEQTMLVKRNDMFLFCMSGSLEVGDILIEIKENSFDETVIESIDLVDEPRTVYHISADPYDVIIAANILVHNYKFLF